MRVLLASALVLAALLLAAPLAAAQAPPPWAYYPLGVGDVWEYDEQWRGTTLRVENVADTVIAGRAYVVQTRTRFDSLGNATEAFPRSSLRYDTATAFVMRAAFTVSGEEFVWGRVPCPLDAQPPTVGCSDFGTITYSVMTYTADVTIGDTTVQDVPQKRYGSSGAYFVLAAGLGEVLRQPKFDPPDVLVYARIAGVEYGAPRYPVAAEPSPTAPPPLAMAVWPNPVRGGAVRLALALPEPAAVEADVVDLLGRRVLVQDLGRLPAGRHEAALDLRALAPGLYLLRVTAGARAATRALAVSG
jgi:hypothetical protein